MKDTTKVIIVILAVVAITTAVPQYQSFESRYGEEIVAREDIEVDEEAKYLLASITPIKGNLIQTVNLHDFAASKGFFDATKHFACSNKQYVPQSEVGRYGDRITQFCRDHEVVYAEKHFLSRKRRSLNMMAGPALWCGMCIGSCH